MRFRALCLQRQTLFSRLIVVFAFLHTMAPAVASIADAWAERGASRVVQIGEPGSSNYLPAHPDDCALCIATAAITGSGEVRPPLPLVQLVRQTPTAYSEVRRARQVRFAASQRAPPALS